MTPKQALESLLRKTNQLRRDEFISEEIKTLQKAIEVLRILKEYAETSVEKSEFINDEEHKYTAIVIELPNDGGIDYTTIKEFMEVNDEINNDIRAPRASGKDS